MGRGQEHVLQGAPPPPLRYWNGWWLVPGQQERESEKQVLERVEGDRSCQLLLC